MCASWSITSQKPVNTTRRFMFKEEWKVTLKKPERQKIGNHNSLELSLMPGLCCVTTPHLPSRRPQKEKTKINPQCMYLYLHACHVTYCRRLRSLLLSLFWALINSPVSWRKKQPTNLLHRPSAKCIKLYSYHHLLFVHYCVFTI